MHDDQRAFLDALLSTPSPSGYEAACQRVWLDYVSDFADDVRADDYGNAVAVYEGSGEGPSIAVAGHADEIGFVVRDVVEDGFLRIARLGGADRTVSKGQHVTVHARDPDGDGPTDTTPVPGVIGQTAIHLRDSGNEAYEDIDEQFVDVGAGSEEEAAELVEVGDPVTVDTTIRNLHGTRVTANGMDNRIGIWAAAESLRRAVENDVDATVYAVSTVQEEVGLKGAEMVGFDLDLDAALVVDVTHATDSPEFRSKPKLRGPVELGAGPVVTRGTTNHPVLVDVVREAADGAGVDHQLQAVGIQTGTDADAFYTSRGGVPTVSLGLPNRYMHTPVEVIDTDDLDALADLLAAVAERAGAVDSFGVDI